MRHVLQKQPREKLLHDTRHEKTDLTVFVVVIPKEGWYDNNKELKISFLVTRVTSKTLY